MGGNERGGDGANSKFQKPKTKNQKPKMAAGAADGRGRRQFRQFQKPKTKYQKPKMADGAGAAGTVTMETVTARSEVNGDDGWIRD